MFSVRFTLVLAGALVLPLCVREISGVEPYPAILLPTGATLVRELEGVVEFQSLALYAGRASGEELRLKVTSFMDPIPGHYLGGLATRVFGQLNVSRRQLRLGPLGEWSVNAKRASATERLQALEWLAARVFSADADAATLILRLETHHVEVATGKWYPPETRDEVRIALR